MAQVNFVSSYSLLFQICQVQIRAYIGQDSSEMAIKRTLTIKSKTEILKS